MATRAAERIQSRTRTVPAEPNGAVSKIRRVVEVDKGTAHCSCEARLWRGDHELTDEVEIGSRQVDGFIEVVFLAVVRASREKVFSALEDELSRPALPDKPALM